MALDSRQKSDKALLLLIKIGDERAFAEAFDRYWPLLYQFASRLLADGDEAMDATQDAFVRLWENRHRLDGNGTLKGYLYTITKNRIFEGIRRTKVHAQFMEELGQAYSEGTDATTDALEGKELAARFEAELANLPPKMREAFELSRIEDLSYREIAERMDITDSTVKQHISKVLRIMRDRLATWLIF